MSEKKGRKARRDATSSSGEKVETAAPTGLDASSLYLNRELSLLEFNRRVLQQAQDTSNPLLERLRFLTICSTNMDEVFEIRVGSIRQHLDLELGSPAADGMPPREVLKQVGQGAHELVAEQYRVLRDEIMPALEAEGIKINLRRSWNPKVRAWARDYFEREVRPVLTPVGLDPAHPFPLVLNKSLNFAVSLEGKDAFGRASRTAVVQAPRVLPRLIALPEEIAGTDHHFVTLSGIIHDNVHEMFPGMEVTGCFPFRVTRNSDLWVDEEEVEDLLRALKGELPRRNFGRAVRLEVNLSCPEEMRRLLLEQFDLGEQDLYRVDGPVNIYRLAMLIDLVDRPDLKFRPFTPGVPRRLAHAEDIFEVIRGGDVLLHHPFQSFQPVLQLLEDSAADPNVLAIKITLYRTGVASAMTHALLEAARNGKEVTAVVELRARFEEAANIRIATRLQEAGAKVIYGMVGYKAHAKMILVVRREGDRLRRYVHLGTGNYHLKNVRTYTDFGLLSADDGLGADVQALFQQLTGLGNVIGLDKLLQSPFSLHDHVMASIDREIENARAGRSAFIRAKMNALIEPKVIRALYRASQAGVQVDLLVRGICCLRPQVAGVSENIRVLSTVGRFLEHSRIFHFCAGGKDEVWCSSADWMPRNFFRRVETAFPVEDLELKRRVLEEGIDPYVRDNVQTWELASDGSYAKPSRGSATPYLAQRHLLELLADGASV